MSDFYRAEPATVDPLLVDAVSAAKLLSISQKTLWLYTQSGEIPHRRIGSRVLYPLALLRAYAETGTTNSAMKNASGG
jgi:excisionase family DNA binding protein